MYGQTWADLMTTPPQLAWQMLRTLRHAPPGRAAQGDRKATFDAAMEQAEQFFAAARVSGSATRPVQIFYGLTQAGWAVAAAASAAEGNGWRLAGGHGLETGPLQNLRNHGIATLTLKDKGKGSFTQLASILGAASLPQSTSLGDLWCLLPEAERFPLPEMGAARPLTVKEEFEPAVLSLPVVARVSPLPSYLAHQVTSEENPSVGQEEGWREERRRVTDYLASYPTLTGLPFATSDGNPVGLAYVGPGRMEVPLRLGEFGPGLSPDDKIATLTAGYRGQRLAFPTVGGSSHPAHPFLLWWAVSFALSMLARYEPKGWAERISVSDSADASPIEHLLDQALVILPELIHRTVRQAASSPKT